MKSGFIIFISILLVFAFTACEPEKEPNPCPADCACNGLGNCGHDDCSCEAPTLRNNQTEQTLPFGTNLKVTIKGNATDVYLNSEWNQHVADVIANIVTLSPTGDAADAFKDGRGATIILEKVPSGGYTDYNVIDDGKTLYIKVGSINSIDYPFIMLVMGGDENWLAKLTPKAKGNDVRMAIVLLKYYFVKT
jgi:hypothetical protein